MISCKVLNNKDFTHKLFLEETFDSFELVQASFKTFCSFEIGGALEEAYYNPKEQEEQKALNRRHVTWKEVKPFCLAVIRGRRAPVSFKLVFLLSGEAKALLPGQREGETVPVPVDYALNITYSHQEILCTSGISYHAFSKGFHPDHDWDHVLLEFLKNHQITFEVL